MISKEFVEILTDTVKRVDAKYSRLLGEMRAELRDEIRHAIASVQLVPGPRGEPGQKGDAGPRGERGEVGQAGIAGTNGKDGAPGIRGEKGDPGTNGKDGAPGALGERGPAGPMGPIGQKGDTGAPGESIQGPQGPPGARGEKGEKGDPGVVGAPGETGPKGEKGDRGEPGKDARDGRDGKDGKDGKDGSPGRDAFELDIHTSIDPAKTYQRGALAVKNGGLFRFTGSEWMCLADGIADIEVELVDDRHVGVRIERASGKTTVKAFKLATPRYKEIWKSEPYEAGDIVTWDGSMWFAMKDTETKPGDSGSDWRLCVKRGRAGKSYDPPKPE